MNILIVDDQAIYRDLLTAILEDWPEHQVSSVATGEAALALLQTAEPRFDLIFLDVSLPGLSGLAVLTQIRAAPLHRSLPVIMCTSASAQSTMTRAIDLGATNYLIKPCTPEDLARILRQVGALPDIPAK